MNCHRSYHSTGKFWLPLPDDASRREVDVLQRGGVQDNPEATLVRLTDEVVEVTQGPQNGSMSRKSLTS